MNTDPTQAEPLADALHPRLLALLERETASALSFGYRSSGAVHHDGRVVGVMAAIRLLPEPLAVDPSPLDGPWYIAALRSEIVALRERQADCRAGSASHRHLAGMILGIGAAMAEAEAVGGQT